MRRNSTCIYHTSVGSLQLVWQSLGPMLELCDIVCGMRVCNFLKVIWSISTASIVQAKVHLHCTALCESLLHMVNTSIQPILMIARAVALQNLPAGQIIVPLHVTLSPQYSFSDTPETGLKMYCTHDPNVLQKWSHDHNALCLNFHSSGFDVLYPVKSNGFSFHGYISRQISLHGFFVCQNHCHKCPCQLTGGVNFVYLSGKLAEC